jgi:hypothetical protein
MFIKNSADKVDIWLSFMKKIGANRDVLAVIDRRMSTGKYVL